jgi:choline monooxygenase
VQTVGVRPCKLGKPGTDTRSGTLGAAAPAGAAAQVRRHLLTGYPEHHIGSVSASLLVVSTLHPQGPDKTLNVTEFFLSRRDLRLRGIHRSPAGGLHVVVRVEDDELALRMDAGRKALLQRGDNEFGPYQSPMEDGSIFTEWYRRNGRQQDNAMI